MRSSTRGQLLLFPGVEAPARPSVPAPVRRPAPRGSRADRMAARLDDLAAAAERELADAWRAGDTVTAQAAHERARGARRAAELLRAGPAGVAEVLGGTGEAA
jgi:hypothetical protein